MPFTPSHALVALPFIRTPLVPAAIAIGAMTPDLPLFVRGVGLNYSFTHTFGNVVWTALLAFALFLIWRVVLRPAVPELVPLWLARRLPDDWDDRGLAAVRSARMPYDLTVTVSVGSSTGTLSGESDWAALYRMADQALFAAKAAGRDRARVASLALAA